jgi:predicted amidohydrolase YtcJ
VRVDGVKYFHDDFARITRFELSQIFETHATAGRRVVLHVLSERALRSFLDAIEPFERAHPGSARWFRVDHGDEIPPAEATRLKKLGIAVCSNPSMIPEWKTDRAFPMRTLISAGVRTCIGTDWLGHHVPERALEPLTSMMLAVTHGGFGSQERITAAEALDAYTAGSAIAEGQGADKGTLEVGKWADLVVLSDDPLAVSAEQIDHLQVLLTMVGGQVVYRRPGFAEPIPDRRPPSIGPPPTASPPSIGPARDGGARPR